MPLSWSPHTRDKTLSTIIHIVDLTIQTMYRQQAFMILCQTVTIPVVHETFRVSSLNDGTIRRVSADIMEANEGLIYCVPFRPTIAPCYSMRPHSVKHHDSYV